MATRHFASLFSYAEVLVIVLFGSVILLWCFREPGFVAGWNDLFPGG